MFTEFTHNAGERDRLVVDSVVFVTFFIYRTDICLFSVRGDFTTRYGFLKYEFDGRCDVCTKFFKYSAADLVRACGFVWIYVL